MDISMYLVLGALGIFALAVIYAVLRFYVFGILLLKEKTVRATVAEKYCMKEDDKPAEDVDTSDLLYDTGLGRTGYGCAMVFAWLFAMIPWKSILANGLDDPYKVRFYLGGGKKIELTVSYEVYAVMRQGMEGTLTYKGGKLRSFKSTIKDKGGPANIVES